MTVFQATRPGDDRAVDYTLADSAALAAWRRKEILHPYAKHAAEEINLGVGHGRAAGFNVGDDIAGQVAPQNLKFGHQIILPPTTLITQFGDHGTDQIGPIPWTLSELLEQTIADGRKLRV